LKACGAEAAQHDIAAGGDGLSQRSSNAGSLERACQQPGGVSPEVTAEAHDR
jgi:hypothetical protein